MSRESNKDIEKFINQFKAKLKADRKDLERRNAVHEVRKIHIPTVIINSGLLSRPNINMTISYVF